MIQFPRIELTEVIRAASIELGVSKRKIFEEADVHFTNEEKWRNGTSPTKKIENRIFGAIERLAKKKEKNDSKKLRVHPPIKRSESRVNTD